MEGNCWTWTSWPYFRSEAKLKSIRKHLFPLQKPQIMLIIPTKDLPFLSDFLSVFHPGRSFCPFHVASMRRISGGEVSFVCMFDKRNKEMTTSLWWRDHRQMSGKVACRWEEEEKLWIDDYRCMAVWQTFPFRQYEENRYSTNHCVATILLYTSELVLYCLVLVC